MPPRAPARRLTHFLCIPLVTPESRPQLETAFKAIANESKIERVTLHTTQLPKRAIRPISTLHFTLGVMSLLTQERIDAALSLLRTIDLASLLVKPSPSGSDLELNKQAPLGTPDAKPMKVTLRGLASMHSPEKTSILYAKPSAPSNQLESFCLHLQNEFLRAGFLIPDTRPLVLHATIVNTIYVQGGRKHGSRHGRHGAKLTIDAREILERHQDLVWMEDVTISKVAICRMGANKILDGDGNDTGDEAYAIEGEVEMPGAKANEKQ